CAGRSSDGRRKRRSAHHSGRHPNPSLSDQLSTDDDEFNAAMFVVCAQNFYRIHWRTDTVREGMHWTLGSETTWRETAKIKPILKT
ncbi:hypothetical protein, partial [Stenotrophomonas maltophilia group sp. RNC7]|uniref:hypothetical protein n=1 Tax=Stenotrophomonas maltophilia group sp. RNC7 TaxID=3071467 RepID=UPI0027E03E87